MLNLFFLIEVCTALSEWNKVSQMGRMIKTTVHGGKVNTLAQWIERLIPIDGGLEFNNPKTTRIASLLQKTLGVTGRKRAV
ncbi:hypothetical protein SK128_022471 [Halocaridina rubra]|uniref:Uncharacterized protein n=1 Tax=Halocaridina rubra TaxID=373956 RepID=A0AAN8WP85_HALRR